MASADLNMAVSGFVNDWQSGKSVAECNLRMLNSKDSCDVIFRVGQEEKLVQAHRYVLISRSCVFHAMLSGPLAEKCDIKIPDTEEDTFSDLLRYLYTDDCKLTPANVTRLLYLSKKYAVGGLEMLCLSYLDKSLSTENACVILEQAHGFDEKLLFKKALKFILQNGEACLNNRTFNNICYHCLDQVIQSTDLTADAVTVFRSVCDWARTECIRQNKDSSPENMRQVLGKLLYAVPFADMSAKDFASDVIPTGILTGDESTKLFCFFSLPQADISPFKVKSALPKCIGMDHGCSLFSLYERRCHVDQKPDTNLLSWIILRTKVDLQLKGFLLYASGVDNRYHINIENIVSGDFRSIYNNRVNGKLLCDEAEVLLPKPCILKSGNRYRVLVEQVSGQAKYCGCGLLKYVRVGKSGMFVRYSACDDRKMGVISKLIVKEFET